MVNEEAIVDYLTDATEDTNPDVFLSALGGCGQGAGNGTNCQRYGTKGLKAPIKH